VRAERFPIVARFSGSCCDEPHHRRPGCAGAAAIASGAQLLAAPAFTGTVW
jgi:hypothetical protein